jgi:hypothetical protein
MVSSGILSSNLANPFDAGTLCFGRTLPMVPAGAGVT